MTTTYYQKHKEKLRREERRIKIFLKKKKIRGRKGLRQISKSF